MPHSPHALSSSRPAEEAEPYSGLEDGALMDRLADYMMARMVRDGAVAEEDLQQALAWADMIYARGNLPLCERRKCVAMLVRLQVPVDRRADGAR